MGLEAFLEQHAPRPARPPRRTKPAAAVSDQYRKFEARFHEWACRQFDKLCADLQLGEARWLIRCAGHVYAAYLKY